MLYLNRGAHRSRKFMDFKIQTFQACKVMKSGLGAGIPWKVVEYKTKWLQHFRLMCMLLSFAYFMIIAYC